MNHAMRFANACACQITAPLFNAQIKHVLTYFALEMAAITVAKERMY